ncbi:MAG: bifunctional histidinol-phosphatase/imidazoleglycerol-phosphate dehydratase HisB, partial [Steroidobacteraceae bacterium]|nr:bifunctional histidinol-phosphatase/imidazoleglycerol-phosphate dehydratase HisB [Steroidobacteraceae bacterium]
AAMSGERILFIDRDGTIIEEPPDEQVDSLHKLRLLPGVIPALLELQRAGYRLVLVSNQDGLGTASFPEPTFREPQDFLRTLLGSQGIEFDAEFFCPHFPADGCECRKPLTGLLTEFLAARTLDRQDSFVIGDRDTDMQLAANLGIEGLRVRADGNDGATWAAIVARLCRPDRTARVSRTTKETRIDVRVRLDRTAPVAIATGIGFFDHMLEQVARHGGFSLELSCQGDLEVDEHHTVEDCALALGQALRAALGDKRGIARYGFLLPMDESLAQVAIDLSGRAYAVFEGQFGRESVGGLPTELVPHFFRSLADSLGAAIHVQVRGENSHHMVEACFKGVGRALRQAIRIEGTELPSSKGVL